MWKRKERKVMKLHVKFQINILKNKKYIIDTLDEKKRRNKIQRSKEL